MPRMAGELWIEGRTAHAPCDGEAGVLPDSRHGVTFRSALRPDGGCQAGGVHSMTVSAVWDKAALTAS